MSQIIYPILVIFGCVMLLSLASVAIFLHIIDYVKNHHCESYKHMRRN